MQPIRRTDTNPNPNNSRPASNKASEPANKTGLRLYTGPKSDVVTQKSLDATLQDVEKELFQSLTMLTLLDLLGGATDKGRIQTVSENGTSKQTITGSLSVPSYLRGYTLQRKMFSDQSPDFHYVTRRNNPGPNANRWDRTVHAAMTHGIPNYFQRLHRPSMRFLVKLSGKQKKKIALSFIVDPENKALNAYHDIPEGVQINAKNIETTKYPFSQLGTFLSEHPQQIDSILALIKNSVALFKHEVKNRYTRVSDTPRRDSLLDRYLFGFYPFGETTLEELQAESPNLQKKPPKRRAA